MDCNDVSKKGFPILSDGELDRLGKYLNLLPHFLSLAWRSEKNSTEGKSCEMTLMFKKKDSTLTILSYLFGKNLTSFTTTSTQFNTQLLFNALASQIKEISVWRTTKLQVNLSFVFLSNKSILETVAVLRQYGLDNKKTVLLIVSNVFLSEN